LKNKLIIKIPQLANASDPLYKMGCYFMPSFIKGGQAAKPPGGFS